MVDGNYWTAGRQMGLKLIQHGATNHTGNVDIGGVRQLRYGGLRHMNSCHAERYPWRANQNRLAITILYVVVVMSAPFYVQG